MLRVTSPTTRFTLAEFDKLVEADVFGSSRVELLNGRIHFMTQRRPHMVAVSKIVELLLSVRGEDEWIVIQGTMRLDRFNAPDPDLLWLPVPLNTPEHEWGRPLLLVEISDTTYKKDSGTKLRKYARAGVGDYWIVNLIADRIEVYREPITDDRLADCHYASITHFTRGQSIPLLDRPEVSLRVDGLLP